MKAHRGSGKINSKIITVPFFHSIELGGMGKVYIKMGEKERIEVKTDDNLISFVEGEVEDGVLSVYFKEPVRDVTQFEVYATMKEVKALYISGSGMVEGEGKIETEKMKLKISGSGEVSLDLSVKELESKISGSGTIILTGSAHNHKVEVSGSGKVKTFDLLSRCTKLKISGSGKCELNVIEKFNVKISGSGKVKYKGSPEVKERISGCGKLEKVEA